MPNRKPVSRVGLAKKVCSVPGCEKPHNARGWCGTHYRMWMKHGDALYADKGLHLPSVGAKGNTIEDFWRNVSIRGEDDCWLWNKAKDGDGYGFFWFRNRQTRAHRFVAEYVLGINVSEMYVCHTCDNPGCVNPKHLFLGDAMSNKKDSVSKARHVAGERCHMAKLKESQVLAIRRMLNVGKPRKYLASKFGVSRSAIDFIASGRTWKHLLPVPTTFTRS